MTSAFSLQLWEFRAHSLMSKIKSMNRTHDRYHHYQGGESGAEGKTDFIACYSSSTGRKICDYQMTNHMIRWMIT